MKVLITGASGFIGTNLVTAAGTQGLDVLNLDIRSPLCADHNRYWHRTDILDLSALIAAFQSFRPACVVHLAARTDCEENTTVEAGYAVNTEGTNNVLTAIEKTPSVRRVIVTSSQFVFDAGRRLPLHARHYRPRTVYGKSKIVTERLTYAAGLQCVWTIVRPTNVWGPWSLRHVATFFSALRRGIYMHPGRRPCLRSYAFVGNVVHQLLALLWQPREKIHGCVFYLGDRPVNLLDWVNQFSMQITGRQVRIAPRAFVRLLAMLGDLVSGITRKRPLITRSRFRSMTEDYLTPMDATFEALGSPPYSVEEGIAQTVSWLRAYDPSFFSSLLSDTQSSPDEKRAEVESTRSFSPGARARTGGVKPSPRLRT